MSREQALTLASPAGALPAILHRGTDDARLGLLILVGGPQYRVGSHRQFVQLARHLATEGVPVLRFDSAGMGDAPGERPPFDRLDVQVRAAVDRLLSECPGLTGVVLWGLCDGASAALLYGPTDPRVAGLVLVNPWLENARAQARTRLGDYYVRRVLNPDFWRKLLAGGVDLRGSTRELGATVRGAAVPGPEEQAGDGYQQRMLHAFATFDRPLVWLLSGNDLTAGEFWRQYRDDPGWRGAARGKPVRVAWLEDADHTFSRTEWKVWLAAQTGDFIRDLARRSGD